MASSVVHPDRIRVRRDVATAGSGYLVLYWMQQAQRTGDNHALEHAVRRANQLDLPLAVVFCAVDELEINYVLHEPEFDRWAGLPDWARTTLDDHRDDDRPGIRTAAELEAGETDDEVWNAIMGAIRREGWVHNQLRMYWGKQFLRWTNTPEHAFRTALELNNRWFLDGRDANSHANIAWCFGRHDQGLAEREILGKVRPFTDAALKRKGDLDAWVRAQAEVAS